MKVTIRSYQVSMVCTAMATLPLFLFCVFFGMIYLNLRTCIASIVVANPPVMGKCLVEQQLIRMSIQNMAAGY